MMDGSTSQSAQVCRDGSKITQMIFASEIDLSTIRSKQKNTAACALQRYNTDLIYLWAALQSQTPNCPDV